MSRGSGLCPSCELALRKGSLQSDTLSCYLVWGTCSGSWLPSSNCIAGITDGSALLLTVVLLVTKQSSAMKFFVSSIGPANWPHSRWWTYNAEGECIQLWYSLIYNSLACFLRFDAYTTNPNWFDAKREDKIMCLVPLVVGVFDCHFIRARCRRPFITVEKPFFWKSRKRLSLIKRLHHQIVVVCRRMAQIVYVNCRFNAPWCPSNDGILPILSSFSIIWANRMKRNDARRLGGLP